MTENTKPKILFVEDNEQLSKIMAMNLEMRGFEVYAALGGQEGLKLAREKKPHLIILDILMPQMSGYEVLEKLKADAETAAIPVLILSALWGKEDVEKGMKLGAVEFLTKSNLPLTELMNRIEQYLPARNDEA